jgi:hypothetical protein
MRSPDCTPAGITCERRTAPWRTCVGPWSTAPVPCCDPQVAARVAQALQAQLSDILDAFRNRINDPGIASGRPATRRLSQQVTATTSSWRQFLTVRFDDTEAGWLTVEDGSVRTVREHTALVFDTTTGARVLPPDLFTDLDRTSAIVRAALVADHRGHNITADQLASLSLKPSEAGSTTPLTCYPTTGGLRCAVDDGSLTPDYAGPLETTVPWPALALVMQPRLHP